MNNVSLINSPKFKECCYNAVKSAHKEFNAPSVPIDEYARITNQDLYSASELDFNSDEKISIWERASEMVARHFFCNKEDNIVPSMLSNYVYINSDLSTSDVFNKQKPPTCTLDYFS